MAVVVLLLLAIPLLIPGHLFAPRVALAASNRLGEPVRVGAARLFLLPLPHVSISDIEVGRRPFISVDKLTLTPRITSLFADRLVLRSIELNGVRIEQRAFARIQRWAASSDTPDQGHVSIERVILQRVDVRTASVSMRGYEADVRLSPDGALASARMRTDDGRLLVSLAAAGPDQLSVTLSARDWPLPVGPGIRFARLDGRGKLGRHALELEAIDGELYGGAVRADARLGWQKDWVFSGRIELTGMNVEPLAALYTRQTVVSGRLDANSVFEASAGSAAELTEALMLEADFELHDGMLHKVDLASAARLIPGKSDKQEGVTRFDRFAGQLSVDPRGFHFSNVQITSGALDARGYVSIAPDMKLSGRVDTAVKGTGSLVGTPLAVSGSLEAPKVLPTKGTVAGAAAGTLLLGPGIGTTIGIKAGQLTERLFGKKPPAPALSADDRSRAREGASTQQEKKHSSGPTGGR